MKKLISNKAAAVIREKHTQEEIENGIIELGQVRHHDVRGYLQAKLLEEVSEYLFSESEEELKDIELICKEIRKPDKYSEGWVLVNSRGHQQEK